MLNYNLHLNVWVGAAIALAMSLGIGALNGYLVTRTGIAQKPVDQARANHQFRCDDNVPKLHEIPSRLSSRLRPARPRAQAIRIVKEGNGAVEKTRTSTGCPTATSTLRVYQFRHDRTPDSTEAGG